MNAEQQSRLTGKLDFNPLPRKPDAQYAEFVGRSQESSHSFQFSDDQQTFSYMIDVPWDAVLYNDDAINSIIPTLLGYSYIQPLGNNVNVLRRVLPMQCPYYSWLWLKEVSGGRGVKFVGKHEGRYGGLVSDYDRCRLTLTFASRLYNVYSDEIIDNLYAGDESKRFVVKTFDFNAESVSIERGPLFEYAEGPPSLIAAPNNQFNGPRTKVIGKMDLELSWYDVPDDWLFAGGLPIRIDAGVGKINSTIFFGYPIGTLLCMPPKLVPTSKPVDNALLGGGLFEPARSWNVKFLFKHWDPPHGAAATQGWNNAIWPRDMNFYKIWTHDDHAVLYESFDFYNLFKRAG